MDSVSRSERRRRAERFLELHEGDDLLVLPNIWDPLGAQLIASMGFPAVATASAAVAYSHGVDDGECLPWSQMLDVVARITSAVTVPVSADIERGYADDLAGLQRNVRDIVSCGVVGINIEDSVAEGGVLRSIDEQCERIRTCRCTCEAAGMPLVINARIDVYLREGNATAQDRLRETIERARAYRAAGADCVYPITLSDPAALSALADATGAPINVYISSGAPPLETLAQAGVKRISVGPGLLRASVTAMKRAVEALMDGRYDPMTDDALSSDDIRELHSYGG